jgi:CubicO group peptidase (beta-lactamase class C family)
VTTGAPLPDRPPSRGTVAEGFEAVRHTLDGYLLDGPRYSAQLTAIWKGQVVVDLVGGPDLSADAITGVFSVTKGIASVTLARLVTSGRLDLDATVASCWPEFAAAGKQDVLVRELLSHQVGLLNVPGRLQPEDLLDSAQGAAKLAAALPLWRPGSALGYHAFTFGIIVEELHRRVAGETLQAAYERDVRAPRGIDFYLGVPESEEPRYRPVLPMEPTPAQQLEMAAHADDRDSLTNLAFNDEGNDPRLEAVMPNARTGRVAAYSSSSGVGSARGIAQVYAAALGHLGEPLLDPATIAAISQEQISGTDRVLDLQMAFAVGFIKPTQRISYGSFAAFGHDGAGGALGFADPHHDLAFGYSPAPQQYPGGADERGVALSSVVRRCIERLA